jgi:uncharacterized membrane protein YbaN (DUF454 family)
MSERRVPAAPRQPTNTPAPLRWLLISVGAICVGLGVLGIVVPLLPTTPFLLLAGACFIRSSDRLYQRLITHRTLGPYIRNYREHRAITRRARIVTLLGIATAVTVHLVRLTTVADNTPSDGSNDAVQS